MLALAPQVEPASFISKLFRFFSLPAVFVKCQAFLLKAVNTSPFEVILYVCLNQNEMVLEHCLILMKLGTRDLCANMQKTVEQVFEILIEKTILAYLLNFNF